MIDYLEDSYPPINVFETEDAYYVLLFAPNVDRDSLKIVYQRGTIYIQGYLKEPVETEKTKYYYIMEAAYGFFVREIHIGREIDEERIESKFKQGVLIIILPKPGIKEIEVHDG